MTVTDSCGDSAFELSRDVVIDIRSQLRLDRSNSVSDNQTL
jgi:hypothetical protein